LGIILASFPCFNYSEAEAKNTIRSNSYFNQQGSKDVFTLKPSYNREHKIITNRIKPKVLGDDL